MRKPGNLTLDLHLIRSSFDEPITKQTHKPVAVAGVQGGHQAAAGQGSAASEGAGQGAVQHVAAGAQGVLACCHTASVAASYSAAAAAHKGTASSPTCSKSPNSKAAHFEATASPSASAAALAGLSMRGAAGSPVGKGHKAGAGACTKGGMHHHGVSPPLGSSPPKFGGSPPSDPVGKTAWGSADRASSQITQIVDPAAAEEELRDLLVTLPGAASLPHRSTAVLCDYVGAAAEFADGCGLGDAFIWALMVERRTIC